MVAERPAVPHSATQTIIEEIHESFYGEVDKLLADAKIASSLGTDKQDLIDKCERLKALGFTNTKEVKEAQCEISRLDQLRRDNEQKKSLIEAINYFSFKYPHYKFITEKSVGAICEKYGLVYGKIDRYIGTVPDKNLKHIEDFRLNEDDECFVYAEYSSSRRIKHNYLTLTEFKQSKKKNEAAWLMHTQIVHEKCPLEIAAPQADFNMTGYEVKNHQLSAIPVPDPIVLKPVIFNGEKHYLIVTAWGLEASDPLVVNSINN